MHTLTEAEWVQVFYYCGLESSAATEAAREYRGEFYDYEPGYALVRHIQNKDGYVGRWVHTVTSAQLDPYWKKLSYRDEAVAWAKYPEAGLPYREVHRDLLIDIASTCYKMSQYHKNHPPRLARI